MTPEPESSPPVNPTATATFNVLRWHQGTNLESRPDQLAQEEPLEIRIDNRALSVTMRTPGQDEELAAGFLFSEGLLHTKDQILDIKPYPRNPAGNVLNVFLTPEVTIDWHRLTRHVFASSSCGLCGKTTIDSIHQHFKPVPPGTLNVSGDTLLALPDRLRQAQETFAHTGGLHAAALFNPQGDLLVLREDVGRHNAVDKVIGHALLNSRLPLDRQILMVSGRASFEIMQKALAAAIPLVAAISAPSSLAAQFAQDSGQTLVGFLRGQRMNVYACPERIRFIDS
jgi:FdhD protein